MIRIYKLKSVMPQWDFQSKPFLVKWAWATL